MSKDYTIRDSGDSYTLIIDFNISDDSWNHLADLNFLVIYTSKLIFNELELDKEAAQIEYSVLFTNNDSIKQINAKFRNKDYSTNTLSFPSNYVHNSCMILGDIVFAYETILKEAKEQNKEFTHHFLHLLTHSILHLLGYDHVTEKDAIIMENLEIKLLSLLNINNPYLDQ